MAKTVQVRLLCNRTHGDRQESYGEIVAMDVAEARRHVADGIGELAEGQTLPDQEPDAVKTPETASKPAPETAAKPTAPPGGRRRPSA